MKSLICVKRYLSVFFILLSFIFHQAVFAAEPATTEPVAVTKPAATESASSPSTPSTTPSTTPAPTTPAPTSKTESPSAMDVIGQLIWVKGKVEAIDSNKTSRVLERRSPVYEHDTIVTEAAGSGQIKFTDDSLLVLREGTTLRIDQYKFNQNAPTEGKYIGTIVKGGFRTITGLISKGNRQGYAIKTPVATIGVRGTEYSIFYTPSKGLAVKLDKGAITIGNKAGTLDLDKEKHRLYAIIKGINVKPEVTTQASPVFDSQPCFSGSGNRTGVGNCSVKQSPRNSSGNVDSTGFCIQ